MRQELDQAVKRRPEKLVNDRKVNAEQENRDNDHRGGALYFLTRWRGDLAHLGAHVAVEALDTLRPGFDPGHKTVVIDTFDDRRLRHLIPVFPAPAGANYARQILAGAEGFEPPSPVLETGSLTVELTPLN